MPRTRALLSDPDRSLLQATLMDAQVLHESTAVILSREAHKHAQQARAARRANERLTAAEARLERLAWDGADRRRQTDRRTHDFADAA